MKAHISLYTIEELLTQVEIGNFSASRCLADKKTSLFNIQVNTLAELFFVIDWPNQKAPAGFMPVLALQELYARAEKLMNQDRNITPNLSHL